MTKTLVMDVLFDYINFNFFFFLFFVFHCKSTEKI